MSNDIGIHIGYNNIQWDHLFNNFPILPCKLKNDQGFFHYTSLSNALNILNLQAEDNKLANNKNNYISLFASHFLFLNDSAELFDGLKSIIDILKEKYLSIKDSADNAEDIKTILGDYINRYQNIKPNQIINAPNHFIICFCLEGNLLSQWEYYGKECGIAIEFDLNKCLYDGLTSFIAGKPNEPINIAPRKIIYTDKGKDNILNKLRNYEITNVYQAISLAIQSIAIASYMKHPCFYAEKEVRLLFSPLYFTGHELITDAFKLIDYREANGVIKPYMKIHIKHKSKNKSPIKSITVGPGHNQKLVYNAIIKLIQSKFESNNKMIPSSYFLTDKFLEITEIGDIKVRRSTIPFRG